MCLFTGKSWISTNVEQNTSHVLKPIRLSWNKIKLSVFCRFHQTNFAENGKNNSNTKSPNNDKVGRWKKFELRHLKRSNQLESTNWTSDKSRSVLGSGFGCGDSTVNFCSFTLMSVTQMNPATEFNIKSSVVSENVTAKIRFESSRTDGVTETSLVWNSKKIVICSKELIVTITKQKNCWETIDIITLGIWIPG